MQILTPADFAKINELRMAAAEEQVKSGGGGPARRRLAALAAARKANLGENDNFLTEGEIIGVRKKAKATYEERMAKIAEGREGRDKFGSNKHRKLSEKEHSTTNQEKRRSKPFAMVELAARVEAMLRRLDDVRTTKLQVGDLEMDLIEKSVHRGGVKIELLPREFRLLEYFLRHPGRVITRAMLLQEVWQYHFSLETNVVDVHISNLRKKIDTKGMPSLIVNIRGAGFMLNANA